MVAYAFDLAIQEVGRSLRVQIQLCPQSEFQYRQGYKKTKESYIVVCRLGYLFCRQSYPFPILKQKEYVLLKNLCNYKYLRVAVGMRMRVQVLTEARGSDLSGARQLGVTQPGC